MPQCIIAKRHIFYAAPPVIVRQSPPSITVQGATELVLYCGADAYPAATYTWTLDGNFLLLTTEQSLVTLRPAPGTYVCMASNPLGNQTSASIRVSVFGLCVCVCLCVCLCVCVCVCVCVFAQCDSHSHTTASRHASEARQRAHSDCLFAPVVRACRCMCQPRGATAPYLVSRRGYISFWQIWMYDVERARLTDWSRSYSSALPLQWLRSKANGHVLTPCAIAHWRGRIKYPGLLLTSSGRTCWWPTTAPRLPSSTSMPCVPLHHLVLRPLTRDSPQKKTDASAATLRKAGATAGGM